MAQKKWADLTADEKLDEIHDMLDQFISHQNGANARMTTRIRAFDKVIARIDKALEDREKTSGPSA